MKKLAILLILALGLWGALPASAQPARVLALSAGCNNVSLTFPTGTSSSEVASAVSPANAVNALWRLDNLAGLFSGFSPAAPQASDLLTVNFLDAVFVCVSQQASISMPGVPAPPPIQPGPSPSLPPTPTPPPPTPQPSLSTPPITQECGGVTVTVLDVEIRDAEDWEGWRLEGAITVGLIAVQSFNSTARWIDVCPGVSGITIGTDQATLPLPTAFDPSPSAIGTEQARLSVLASSGNTCGEHAPGATKTGTVVFFLRYTPSSDVTSMRYTFFAASDSSTHRSLGPPYDFQIAVSQ